LLGNDYFGGEIDLFSEKKTGIILSYLIEAVKILISLVYTPLMLRLLGRSEFGLYQLVQSVVAYLGLLSFGFGSAYMRYYSRYKAQGDAEEIARLNGMFLTIFCVISVICLCCGSVMILNIEYIFGTGLKIHEIATARILMALMVFNLSITFPDAVFNNFVIAHEKFIFQKIRILLQTLFHPFITLPLLIMGYGSIGMVVVTTGLTIAVFLANIVFCFKKLNVRFQFNGFKWNTFKELFIFTFFIFLNQIIDQINWNVDKFLLGRLVGTTSVAVYGVGAMLNTLYKQLSTSISHIFVPQINRIVAEEQGDNKLTQLLTKVGRIQFLILALVLTGMCFFGKAFIRIWAGPDYTNAYFVVLLLIIPETVPLIQNLGIEIQRAKNKHKMRSVVYFFMAIANILISIPLIKYWGEVGAALGTTFSLLIANIMFMNWYYQKKINLDMFYFWKRICALSKGLIVPLIVGTGISNLFNTDTIFNFCFAVVVYTIVYVISMWLFGMIDEEKKQTLTLFRLKGLQH